MSSAIKIGAYAQEACMFYSANINYKLRRFLIPFI